MKKHSKVSFTKCPICSIKTELNPRYPNMLCVDCSHGSNIVNRTGLRVKFYTSPNKGFETGVITPSRREIIGGNDHICYVKGYKCHADEAHMGGIVIINCLAHLKYTYKI